MKVYIGASNKELAREAAVLLGHMLGHEVVSEWHAGAEPVRPFGDQEWWSNQVMTNLQQLERAELAVIVPKKKSLGPGLLVEAGFALGRGLSVLVFGKRLPTSLLRHPRTHLVRTADELEAKLRELAAGVTLPPLVNPAPPPPKRKVRARATVAARS